ncbi:SMC-Scp complex subunit ScpB [Thalassoroseus pseudoceratinae]|uniref:SMC-Scp complex subunit ScpB n=1 Tax=Thalassoroseus pseudoceratinae TaxID=2713176 RepID=UPI0014245133|nr:SMC-Scp complex subunit ScpB [Thalassoroseus pseudoceratinae]
MEEPNRTELDDLEIEEPAAEDAISDDSATDELDEAYLRAVETIDNIEAELPGLESGYDGDDDEVGSLNDFPGFQAPEKPDASDEEPESAPEESVEETEDAPEVIPIGPRLQAHQILESALFVGGEPLTSKKLVGVLGDGFDRDYVEHALHELNVQYDRERRPYEISLVEGGWIMKLRHEYEPIRHKVYGYGPKEIRLSQEALEMLSLIAYHQPISKEEVEKHFGSRPNAVLSQLLRRELIQLKRDPDDKKNVNYETTARFLQLFGLGSLDELPRAGDLYFK